MIKGSGSTRRALTAGLAVAIILAGASASTGAKAAQFRPGPGHGRGLLALKTILELRLSEDQQVKMLGIINRYEDRMAPLRKRLVQARKDLGSILRSGSVDEERLRKALRESSSVRQELFVLRAKMMAELREVLTAKQRSLLEKKRARMRERIRERLGALVPPPAE